MSLKLICSFLQKFNEASFKDWKVLKIFFCVFEDAIEKITSENSNTFYILERQGRIQCSEIWFAKQLDGSSSARNVGSWALCWMQQWFFLRITKSFTLCIRGRILFCRHKENPKYSIALHQRAVRSQEFLLSPSLLFLLHAYDKVYSLLTTNYSILGDVVLILNRRWQQLPGCIQRCDLAQRFSFPRRTCTDTPGKPAISTSTWRTSNTNIKKYKL